MAESNIIQMHDYAGNNQYPVTLVSIVYDEDGEAVSKKLALLLDWFEWGDDAHSSVKTKYHFWSEKQLGAGGIGEEGEGGGGGIGTITGIKVNGEKYDEPDEMGLLTLPDYPTSLEWANIAGRPENLSEFTDDVVAGHYLPLSGGTITGNLNINGYLYANSRIVEKNIMEFHHTDGDFVFLANDKFSGKGDGQGLAMYNKTYWHSLLHSGNYSDYAYPKDGRGHLSFDASGRPVMANNQGYSAYNSSGVREEIMWMGSDDYVYIGGSTSRKVYIHGNLTINGKQAIHSGNVGEYAVIKSTAIDLSQTNLNVVGYGTSASGWLVYGPAIAIGHPNGYTMLLQQRTDDNRIHVNRKNPNGIAGGWNTIAFTDSTVEAANRLATPRTIWGQSFDGTGDVKNSLTDVTFITFRDTTTSSGIYQGSILNPNLDDDDIGIYTPTLYISGYVGIGTMTPRVKLDINGDIYAAEYSSLRNDKRWIFGAAAITGKDNHFVFTDATTYSAHLIIDSTTSSVGINTIPEYRLDVPVNARLVNIIFQNSDEINRYGGDLWLQYRNSNGTGNVRMCYTGGGVTIGGVDVGDYAFHVAGNARFQDSLTIGSAVLSWDSVNNALKIEGNVYATGQIAAGGVGTEVQKVFNIAAVIAEEGKEEEAEDKANKPYTATLAHNLNTYDLAVVVYEVEEIAQSDGTTTEKLTQVLADVTLTDENNVTVYFATRKINRKYRIVIIG